MLKGLGALANLGNIMQQAKEVGGKMQAAQERLRQQRVTGAAGGGMVEVEMTGAGEALAVRIDAALVASGDREMIEDLLPAAINAALEKTRALHAEAMQEAAAGMNMPGMPDMSELLGKLGR